MVLGIAATTSIRGPTSLPIALITQPFAIGGQP